MKEFLRKFFEREGDVFSLENYSNKDHRTLVHSNITSTFENSVNQKASFRTISDKVMPQRTIIHLLIP